MIFKEITINGYKIPLKIPIENCCPHCGYYNDPKIVNIISNLSTKDKLKVFAIIFKTTCCSKMFASFYLFEEFNAYEKVKYLFTYPSIKPEILPPELKEISPNFVKMFNQAKAAADLGHFELACIGYRSSIEFLLKDFLIKIRGLEEIKISKMKLADVISYFEEKEIFISADVVRILGNDKTHYIEKYNFNLQEVKTYLKILINSILREILLANPPVKRK